MRKALYVVFEGIDGSGKTTLVKKLATQALLEFGEAISTREPTNSIYGQAIRKGSMAGTLSADDEVMLFVADRKEHMKTVVEPNLERKCIILQDRSFISSAAYQATHPQGGWSVEEIIDENKFATVPDLVIFLDLDPKDALNRLSSRKTTDSFETLDRLERVRDVYFELAQKMNTRDCLTCVFSANLGQEIIYKMSWDLIRSMAISRFNN